MKGVSIRFLNGENSFRIESSRPLQGVHTRIVTPHWCARVRVRWKKMIACGDVRACSRDEVVQGMEGLRERQFPFTHLFFSFFLFFLPPNFRYLHLRWGYRRADHPTTSPAGASYNHTRAVPLVTLFARVKAAETVCTAPHPLSSFFTRMWKK